MLTPIFELEQDNTFLTVCIKVPYAKVSDTDIYFNDHDFKFYCKPYFLRLTLPGQVIYSEDPIVNYNADEGKFIIKMTKMTPGENFEGLDFLTKLLATKSEMGSAAPKIEVLGEVSCESFEEFDWEIEQPINNTEVDDFFVASSSKCGFANKYSCSAFKLKDETSEIFDVTNPEKKSATARTEERIETENRHFNEDHYLADLYNDEEIQHLLNYQTNWDAEEKCMENVHFTLEEKDQLRKLPNKEYLLENNEVKSLLLGLVDILFSYCYNKRTTEDENTVESGWTINKISATLCWLETFGSAKSVVQTCIRRSLCYPLHRHWKLSLQVLDDTIKILLLGPKCVVKCLLEIHNLFNQSDPRYLLNDLYITDYCVWSQGKSCCSKNLKQLANALKGIHLTKADIGFDLIELEQGADLAVSEQNDSNNLCQNESCSTVENLIEKQDYIEKPQCSSQRDIIEAVEIEYISDDLSASSSLSGSVSICETISDSDDDSSSSEDFLHNSLNRNQSFEKQR